MNKNVLKNISIFLLIASSIFIYISRADSNLIYLELTWPALTDRAIPGPYVEGTEEEDTQPVTVIDTSYFSMPKIDTGIKLILVELVWPPLDAGGFLGPLVEGETEDTLAVDYLETDFKILYAQKIDSEKSKIVVQRSRLSEQLEKISLIINSKSIAGKKDANYFFTVENEIPLIFFEFPNSYLSFGNNKIILEIVSMKNTFQYPLSVEAHFGVKPDLSVDFPDGLYENSNAIIKLVLQKIEEKINSINIYDKNLYEFELTDNGQLLKKFNYSKDDGNLEISNTFKFSAGQHTINLMFQNNPAVTTQFELIAKVEEIPEFQVTCAADYMNFANGEYIIRGTLELDISKFSETLRQKISSVKVDENYSVSSKPSDKIILSNVEFTILESEGFQKIELIDAENKTIRFEYLRLTDIKYEPPKNMEPEIVEPDTKIEIVEPELALEVEIQNLKIFGLTVDELKQKTRVDKSDIEANGLIDFTYEANKTITKIEISFDKGSSWQSIENAVVKLNPDNKTFSLQTKFTDESGKYITHTLFEGNLEIVNKTNREMIVELLTKYADAIKYENSDNALSCFSASYQGTLRYRDYYTVKTLLRDAFSNEETMSCEWQNSSITASGDNAQVQADFIRKLKLTGNPSQLDDKNTVKLNLIKENGNWYFWQDETEKIIGYNGTLPPGPPTRRR